MPYIPLHSHNLQLNRAQSFPTINPSLRRCPRPPFIRFPLPISSAPTTPVQARSSATLSANAKPRPNQPQCACLRTESCAFHNGTWDLIRRRGDQIVLERIEEAEREAELVFNERASARKEQGQDVNLKMWDGKEESVVKFIAIPSVQEVLSIFAKDGWNLNSVVWAWG